MIFVEPDAVLPERPEFEFLRPKKFRIKTMKMGGVLSQGICFPMSLLPKPDKQYSVGDDVTEVLGIKKYDEYGDEEDQNVSEKRRSPVKDFLFRCPVTRPLAKKLFKRSSKETKGFPTFISKTDETRIQNMPYLLKNKENHFVGREKIDGQSGTFVLRRHRGLFRDRFEFIVCSRNNRLGAPDNSSYWHVAKRYRLEEVLRSLIYNSDWVCLQGECIGPKIQGNRYHVSEPDLYCFNLIYPTGKIPCEIAEQRVGQYGLKWAPLVTADYVLPDSVNDVLEYATGKSALYDTLREGVVFRNYGKNISFKAVSPEYLIAHDA